MSVAFTLTLTQTWRLTSWVANPLQRGVQTASLALGEIPFFPEKIRSIYLTVEAAGQV